MRRSMAMGPMGTVERTETDGLNGADPIDEIVAPGAPFPVVIPGPAPTTPEAIAAAKARRVDAKRRMFVELTLPMFAASFSASPLTFTLTGRVTLPGGPADEIEVRGENGLTWRLALDVSSHLPVRLSWMAMPIVTMSTSSTVTVRGGQVSPPTRPPPFPSGDPTAGLAPVEWQMTIADYRVADGVNWPHRLTTSVAGNTHEDLRLGRYRLNPKIDLRIFRPR
jgi:hypothetical protein